MLHAIFMLLFAPPFTHIYEFVLYIYLFTISSDLQSMVLFELLCLYVSVIYEFLLLLRDRIVYISVYTYF